MFSQFHSFLRYVLYGAGTILLSVGGAFGFHLLYKADAMILALLFGGFFGFSVVLVCLFSDKLPSSIIELERQRVALERDTLMGSLTPAQHDQVIASREQVEEQAQARKE